jgi:hypothetical protein
MQKPGNFAAALRVAARVLAPFVLLLLLLTCTGEPPEILRVFWQLNIVEDLEQNLSYQSLSLFVKPNDPDGFEDIEDLYLINDEQELFWRLDVDRWAQTGTDQEVWIGSNSLKMPDGASFPAGEYRILLRDVGGDFAEQTFRLQLVSSTQARRYLPRVDIEQGEIRVSGEADNYRVQVYDTTGRYVASFPVSETPLRVQAITASQPGLHRGFTFKVYGMVQDRNLGTNSGPYYVQP